MGATGLPRTDVLCVVGSAGEPLGLEGCSRLPFTPSIEVSPEEHTASTPTGLDVDVRVPQAPLLEANPEGRAEADVRETTVTLPAGLQLNPSAANGLAACPETPQDGFEQVGFTGFQKYSGLEPPPGAATFTPTFRFTEEGGLAPSCPEASKLGTVQIRTPLLPDELEGYVYLARAGSEPVRLADRALYRRRRQEGRGARQARRRSDARRSRRGRSRPRSGTPRSCRSKNSSSICSVGNARR